MTKTKLYLPIINLLTMSVSAFISCDDSNSDTAKSAIELGEPERGRELKIDDEYGVYFEMDLSGNVMSKSYMTEMYSGFDHHSHGESRATAMDEATVDFSFSRPYDIFKKETACVHHHDAIIPTNATPGGYHLVVYYTGIAENETYIAHNIVLSTTVEEDDHHHDE